MKHRKTVLIVVALVATLGFSSLARSEGWGRFRSRDMRTEDRDRDFRLNRFPRERRESFADSLGHMREDRLDQERRFDNSADRSRSKLMHRERSEHEWHPIRD